MSDRLERILEVLEGHERQASTEVGYSFQVEGVCWRCEVRPGEGAAGVCAPCRSVLLDEAYTAPEDLFARNLHAFRLSECSIVTFDGREVGRATRLVVDEVDSSVDDDVRVINRVAPISIELVLDAQPFTDVFTRLINGYRPIASFSLFDDPPPLPPIPAKAAHRRRYSR